MRTVLVERETQARMRTVMLCFVDPTVADTAMVYCT